MRYIPEDARPPFTAQLAHAADALLHHHIADTGIADARRRADKAPMIDRGHHFLLNFVRRFSTAAPADSATHFSYRRRPISGNIAIRL